jgi:hypothetical protein
MPDKIVIPKTKIVKSESFIGSAVDLLKEIRIISGVNYRKYRENEKHLNSYNNTYSNTFNYINKMIDEFKNKFELKGFKK